MDRIIANINQVITVIIISCKYSCQSISNKVLGWADMVAYGAVSNMLTLWIGEVRELICEVDDVLLLFSNVITASSSSAVSILAKVFLIKSWGEQIWSPTVSIMLTLWIWEVHMGLFCEINDVLLLFFNVIIVIIISCKYSCQSISNEVLGWAVMGAFGVKYKTFT